MSTPDAADLGWIGQVLAGWQYDGAPLQLHPGDLGWHSQRGAARTAECLRIWTRDGRLQALGLLDGPQLLRMALDPAVRDEDVLVRRVVADVDDPARGVLEAGQAVVEARGADPLNALLADRGWQHDDPWTPLRLDLAGPVGDAGARVEEVGPERAADWVPVHWSAFRGTPFTDEDREDFLERWNAMASGPFYGSAVSLVAYDHEDTPVAVTTVWPAGPGRPGVIEPMGVHRDHRGHGYGAAITRAGAAALQRAGASSAIVCTPASNEGAVATYLAAGFSAETPVPDLMRPS